MSTGISGLYENTKGAKEDCESRWIACADGSAYCLKCGRAQRERSARCPNCNREMKGEDDAGRKQPPARL